MVTQPYRALLIGLEPKLADELELTLARMGHTASRSNLEQLPSVARGHQAIFCSDRGDHVISLVSLVRSLRTPILVIVASRRADISAWLEALEAGADDYCSTPFETGQLGWALKQSCAGTARSAVSESRILY